MTPYPTTSSPHRPALTVGELATLRRGTSVRVDHIGKRLVTFTYGNGTEDATFDDRLTPTGEQAPADWGQS